MNTSICFGSLDMAIWYLGPRSSNARIRDNLGTMNIWNVVDAQDTAKRSFDIKEVAPLASKSSHPEEVGLSRVVFTVLPFVSRAAQRVYPL